MVVMKTTVLLVLLPKLYKLKKDKPTENAYNVMVLVIVVVLPIKLQTVKVALPQKLSVLQANPVKLAIPLVKPVMDLVLLLAYLVKMVTFWLMVTANLVIKTVPHVLDLDLINVQTVKLQLSTELVITAILAIPLVLLVLDLLKTNVQVVLMLKKLLNF